MRYGVVGSEDRETLAIGNTTNGYLTGLNSSTTYSVEVAAVNGAGVGVYSDPLSVTTFGK